MTTPPRSWRLVLPWQRPPLTLNPARHGGWAAHAALVKRVRTEGRRAALAAGVPEGLERVALELHYRPRDKRRRDPRNLAPTLKALEDGLVDAGVVPDDTPEYVDGTGQELYVDPVEPGHPGALYLIVREVTG